MEHRCGTRQTVPALTTLYPRLSGPVRGRVRDVSISGMFVETRATPQAFPLQSLVEVELVVPGPSGPRRCRCLAMVARATLDGIGLMFDRLSPPAVSRLLAVRDALPKAPAARRRLHAVPDAAEEPSAANVGG